MKRSSPVVLGFIWGMFSMVVSFSMITVFASLQLQLSGFPLLSNDMQTQYIIFGAILLLSIFGSIGAAIVNRLNILGGLLILLSCISMAVFFFAPVLLRMVAFGQIEAYGLEISPLMLLISDIVMIAFTVIGLAGGVLAFIPKRARKAAVPVPPVYAAPYQPSPYDMPVFVPPPVESPDVVSPPPVNTAPVEPAPPADSDDPAERPENESPEL